MFGSSGGANGGGDDEGSSDDDADREAFDKAVTNIVHRVLREENKKERGAGDVKMVAFESLQVCLVNEIAQRCHHVCCRQNTN